MWEAGRSAMLMLVPRRWALPLACLAGMGCLSVSQAWASARVALVIGNGAYKSAPVLENPTVDAHAISAALKRLGFEVIEGYDLNGIDMRAKLDDFTEALGDSKVALLYYAGHGVSIDEENYLLATDLVVRSAPQLKNNGMRLSQIMETMKRDQRANVIILDACRDNPFSKELAGDVSRGVAGGRGLSPIDSSMARGSLIAFATDPKKTAMDGLQGDNSPFTKALLKNIETPGITIDTMMNRVREDVDTITNHKQRPWVNTSLVGGDLYLNPVVTAALPGAAATATAPIAAPGPDRLTQENTFWQSAEKSGLGEDYQVYLDAYPTGIYAQMAKNRISRLKTASLPVVPQPAAIQQKSVEPGTAGATAEPVPVVKPTVTAAELKADIATPATEKLLNLSDATRRDLKLRLKLMGFDPGSENAKFDDKTRAQIGEWQKSHELPATTSLSRIQVAALTEQSEAQYQRYKSAQPMVPQALGSQAPTRSLIRDVPRPVAPAIRQAQRARAVVPQAPRQRSGGGGGGGGGGDGGGGAAAAAFMGGVIGGALGGIKWH